MAVATEIRNASCAKSLPLKPWNVVAMAKNMKTTAQEFCGRQPSENSVKTEASPEQGDRKNHRNP